MCLLSGSWVNKDFQQKNQKPIFATAKRFQKT